MANFEVTRSFGAFVENAKIKFSKLYLRQIISGSSRNQSTVIEKNSGTGLGETAVNNWAIYDGVDSGAKLVAKAQGMHTYAGNWYNWFTMSFEVERFKGSSLQVMGASNGGEEDELSIVGGTGDFAVARGIITKKVHKRTHDMVTYELTVEGFCRMKVPAPAKVEPWGVKDAPLHEMEGKSQRLKSVTFYFGGAIRAIQFSYIGEDGEIRSSELWGISEQPNAPSTVETIKFGPTEVIKEISGTVGDPDYLSKLKIVTNLRTYGPFSDRNGKPQFSFMVPKDKTVVGFYVNADDYICKIGVYTI